MGVEYSLCGLLQSNTHTLAGWCKAPAREGCDIINNAHKNSLSTASNCFYLQVEWLEQDAATGSTTWHAPVPVSGCKTLALPTQNAV
jgi:hypothetical protein